MSELKQFTRNEVANDKSRKLLVIHDKVYDVTIFLNEHPGGEEVLLEHAGKESSEDFDDVGHSQDAFDLMNKYRIGEIVEAERNHKKPKKGWVAGQANTDKQLSKPGLPMSVLIGAIVVLNLAIYYYSSSS